MTTLEQQLREALARTPPVPEDPAFARRIVGRARRRRHWRTVAGCGLAAAVVVVAVAWMSPGSRPVAVHPTPSPVTPSGLGDLDCAPGGSGPATGNTVVATGAVVARLCGGLIDNGGYDSLWPSDVLRGAFVDRLTDRLNSLRPFVQPRLCELVGGPGFAVVLGYPDGTQVLLRGSVVGNCAHLEAPDGTTWSDSNGVLQRVLTLIAEQRRQEGPSSGPAPEPCPQQWQDVFTTMSVKPLAPGAPAAVTACRYHLRLDPRHIDQSAKGRLTDQVVVTHPSRLLAAARAGGVTDPCQGKGYRLDPFQELLMVRNVWGDVNVVTANAPCWPSTLTGPRRYPNSALAGEVAALFSSEAARPQ